MKEKLSKRQEQILLFLRDYIRKEGYPPSVREIGKAVGLRSPSTVHSHLEKLQDNGYIKKNPSQPRTIGVLEQEGEYRHDAEKIYLDTDFRSVPIVGQITAGQPVLAQENIEDTITMPSEFLRSGDHFALRVKGDSMINAGIMEGDMAIIKQQSTAENGEIVAALIEDEATLKRFYRENDYIRLQPENDYRQPIKTKDAVILGKMVTLIRRY